MGGGPRPWLDNVVAVTVKSVNANNGQIVLVADDRDVPSDIKAGEKYVVVFHRPPAGDSSGAGKQS